MMHTSSVTTAEATNPNAQSTMSGRSDLWNLLADVICIAVDLEMYPLIAVDDTHARLGTCLVMKVIVPKHRGAAAKASKAISAVLSCVVNRHRFQLLCTEWVRRSRGDCDGYSWLNRERATHKFVCSAASLDQRYGSGLSCIVRPGRFHCEVSCGVSEAAFQP